MYLSLYSSIHLSSYYTILSGYVLLIALSLSLIFFFFLVQTVKRYIYPMLFHKLIMMYLYAKSEISVKCAKFYLHEVL